MVDIIEAYNQGKTHINLLGTDAFKISKSKPGKSLPIFLTDNKDIKQYSDEYLYQTEIALRKWLEIKCQDKAWCRNYKLRRYTYGMLIKEIYGRDYDPKIDRNRTSVSQMFAHYSSKVTKYYYDASMNYKTKNSTCYHISPKRYHIMKAFGLRLQSEILMEQGIVPTNYNIVHYNRKPLKRGHARNPRTEANMQRRSKIAKEKYLEYQKQYRESHKQKS